MNKITDLKISKKIYLGFGLLVALLAIVSAFAGKGLLTTADNFSEYRSIARSTNVVGRVQANMLSMRMGAKDFIISGSDKAIKAVEKRSSETLQYIADAIKLIADPKQLEQVKSLDGDIKTYASTFAAVKGLQAKRNVLVDSSLNKRGPAMEKGLSEVMKSAFEDNDAEAAYLAGVAQKYLLLGRLYGQKFLILNSDDVLTRAQTELNKMSDAMKDLLSKLENPTRRALAQKVIADWKVYSADLANVADVIKNRNDLIHNTLDQIGPKVASDIENIKLSNKAKQDELGPRAESEINNAVSTMTVISIVGLILAALAAFFIVRSIAGPVVRMTSAMGGLAEGNLEMEVPAQGRKDEIGQMAEAVQVFKENAIRNKQLEADQEEQKIRAEKEKRELMNKLADEFNASVGGIVETVSSASAELNTTAQSMAEIADETSSQAGSVAAASEEASANVQTVASATEEMAASIKEINQQVAEASNASKRAVEDVNRTAADMETLAETADKISGVVSMIADIAEQTNLLALNATIESARAGEAGKGFAVVATEVKALANETAKATDGISDLIAEVQGQTKTAVGAISNIGTVINQLDSTSTAIAAAMEEQGATTQEVSRNVAEAAAGTEEVSSNIAGVTQASQEAGAAAGQVTSAAGELSKQAELMRSEVRKFVEQVRAA